MIVDASILLRWFLNEPGAGDVAALFAQRALSAPDLIIVETANGLWSAVRAKRVDDETARAYIARAPDLFSDLRDSAALVAPAFDIARALDHAVYDCFYLALAEAERKPLLTADKRLQAKTDGTKWRHLISVITP